MILQFACTYKNINCWHILHLPGAKPFNYSCYLDYASIYCQYNPLNHSQLLYGTKALTLYTLHVGYILYSCAMSLRIDSIYRLGFVIQLLNVFCERGVKFLSKTHLKFVLQRVKKSQFIFERNSSGFVHWILNGLFKLIANLCSWKWLNMIFKHTLSKGRLGKFSMLRGFTSRAPPCGLQ